MNTVSISASGRRCRAGASTDAQGACHAGRGAAAARGVKVTPDGILFSKSVRSLADLRDDNEAAAAEAAAQGGACEGPLPLAAEPWHARRACIDAFEDALER